MKACLSLVYSCLLGCATVSGFRAEGEDPCRGLIDAAQLIDADELLVLNDGNVSVRWTSGRYEAPHQLMSVTKSVVALALGKVVEDGKLHLEDRMDRFFPAWHGDPRGSITVQQLLEHTSGLGTTFPNNDVDNIVEEALRQPLLHAPGSTFFYNNDAVNLLSGIVEIITGGSLQEYVRQVLFEPLGITDWSWYTDDYGHTWVMTGLALDPDQLARIGLVMLNGGKWRGKKIVSEAWVERLSQRSAAAEDHGALWWVGFDDLEDIPLSSRVVAHQMIAAQGFANQLLVIEPTSKTVMVLQTELLRRANRDNVGGPIDKFLSVYCAFVASLKSAKTR